LEGNVNLKSKKEEKGEEVFLQILWEEREKGTLSDPGL